MKFSCSVRVVKRGSLSFTGPDSAKGNPLGEALFAIDGVRIVFAVNDFVSVTKTNDANWFHLTPQIETTLAAHLSAAAGSA